LDSLVILLDGRAFQTYLEKHRMSEIILLTFKMRFSILIAFSISYEYGFRKYFSIYLLNDWEYLLNDWDFVLIPSSLLTILYKKLGLRIVYG
jgi:hypothetical protein